MKKTIVLMFFIFVFFLFFSCGSGEKPPKLEDFCGQTPLDAFTNYDNEYFLCFREKGGPAFVMVEVNRSEYKFYKDLGKPIDCE